MRRRLLRQWRLLLGLCLCRRSLRWLRRWLLRLLRLWPRPSVLRLQLWLRVLLQLPPHLLSLCFRRNLTRHSCCWMGGGGRRGNARAARGRAPLGGRRSRGGGASWGAGTAAHLGKQLLHVDLHLVQTPLHLVHSHLQLRRRGALHRRKQIGRRQRSAAALNVVKRKSVLQALLLPILAPLPRGRCLTGTARLPIPEHLSDERRRPRGSSTVLRRRQLPGGAGVGGVGSSHCAGAGAATHAMGFKC
mmetsp:Transcript_21494/g.60074  ORF Transcript_21494/g.60074 Transcript_21494/m.60074 type:complete len:246 (+) Transcript_21494:514-1251(+)